MVWAAGEQPRPPQEEGPGDSVEEPEEPAVP